MQTRVCALVFLMLGVAGCVSQRAADFGCALDAAKICEGIKHEDIALGLYRSEPHTLEQNSPPTMAVEMPLRLPNGEVGAELVCNMNSRSRKIIYSQVTKPPQSEQSAAYFKEQGLCSE